MTIVHRDAYKKGTCFTPDKRKFFDEAEAQREAVRIYEAKRRDVNVYECGNHWHHTTARMGR